MHPEVKSQTPGKCPKCGMSLVKEGSAHINTRKNDYGKLFVIFLLITLVTVSISIKDVLTGTLELRNVIGYFMSSFFVTFAGFKLLDLKGFVDGYVTYDLIAQRFRPYGYLYPFIELFFGLSMIIIPHAKSILVAEIIIMLVSGFGVILKLAKKERFTCSCLGTFLNVPLTKITLIEDFGMALLAGLLLLIK